MDSLITKMVQQPYYRIISDKRCPPRKTIIILCVLKELEEQCSCIQHLHGDILKYCDWQDLTGVGYYSCVYPVKKSGPFKTSPWHIQSTGLNWEGADWGDEDPDWAKPPPPPKNPFGPGPNIGPSYS